MTARPRALAISCGDCFFCGRKLSAACETTNPGRGAILDIPMSPPRDAMRLDASVDTDAATAADGST